MNWKRVAVLGPAAGDLRIGHKAKIRERFFVSPPKEALKIRKPAVLLGEGSPVLSSSVTDF